MSCKKIEWHMLALMLLLYNLSYAQDAGSISGKVVDKNSHPVEFVTIFISGKNDSEKVLNGTISDSVGTFLLSNIPDGEYLLNVQMVGFRKITLRTAIDEKNRKITLPLIVIETDTATLARVEVTAIRNMIRKTDEGLVMDATENLTQIGGTAADLLKNMPFVMVSSEGSITLRGKTPLVLINGRVSGIGGTDRSVNLEQIPASSIDRIEIISNPSSKYNADAEGGIINLILKKNTELGTNGAFAVGAGFGDRYRLNGMVMLNHKTEKWNIGIGYDNWYTTRTRRVNGDRIQLNIPNEYYLAQRRSDKRTIQNQMARLDIDYIPDKKNSLTFGATWLFQGEDNHETLTNTTETSEKDFTNRYRRHSNEIRRFNTAEGLLAYTRRFDHPDQLLTFNISTAFDYDRENTLITTQTLSQQNSETGDAFLQKTHNYENSSISNFSVDYIQPVSNIGSIETGYKGIVRALDNDFLRQNQVNSNFVTDTSNTDLFNFNEQIHAIYAQFTGWIGDKQSPKFKITAGLRAEQVLNKANIEVKSYNVKNDYFNLFPSGNLMYYTQKENFIKLSYSKRINRPAFGQLIPFPDITDSLNIHSGNPKLKPELAHSIDLSYNHFLKKGGFIASAFYRKTSRAILSYTVLDSNGVAFSQPLNFGNAETYGLEGILSYNPFNFWTININISSYYLHIENTDPMINVQRNQLTYFAKLSNNFSLWKNGRIQLTGNYTSPIAIPQGEQIAVYFVDMGAQQKIMKGQGRLGLTITDIFNTQKSGVRTSDSNFIYKRFSKVDTRAIMFAFGYTFKSTFKEKLMENKFKND